MSAAQTNLVVPEAYVSMEETKASPPNIEHFGRILAASYFKGDEIGDADKLRLKQMGMPDDMIRRIENRARSILALPYIRLHPLGHIEQAPPFRMPSVGTAIKEARDDAFERRKHALLGYYGKPETSTSVSGHKRPRGGRKGGALYCGKKATAPAGKTKGTAGACFKKGVGVGMMIEKTKLPELSTLSLRELGKYAKLIKVPRYGSMNRADLLEVLEDRVDDIMAALRASVARRPAGAAENLLEGLGTRPSKMAAPKPAPAATATAAATGTAAAAAADDDEAGLPEAYKEGNKPRHKVIYTPGSLSERPSAKVRNIANGLAMLEYWDEMTPREKNELGLGINKYIAMLYAPRFEKAHDLFDKVVRDINNRTKWLDFKHEIDRLVASDGHSGGGRRGMKGGYGDEDADEVEEEIMEQLAASDDPVHQKHFLKELLNHRRKKLHERMDAIVKRMATEGVTDELNEAGMRVHGQLVNLQQESRKAGIHFRLRSLKGYAELVKQLEKKKKEDSESEEEAPQRRSRSKAVVDEDEFMGGARDPYKAYKEALRHFSTHPTLKTTLGPTDYPTARVASVKARRNRKVMDRNTMRMAEGFTPIAEETAADIEGAGTHSPLAKAVMSRRKEKAELFARLAYRAHLEAEMKRLDAILREDPENARVEARLDAAVAEYKRNKAAFEEAQERNEMAKADVAELRKGYGRLDALKSLAQSNAMRNRIARLEEQAVRAWDDYLEIRDELRGESDPEERAKLQRMADENLDVVERLHKLMEQLERDAGRHSTHASHELADPTPPEHAPPFVSPAKKKRVGKLLKSTEETYAAHKAAPASTAARKEFHKALSGEVAARLRGEL